jgi:hypothetical protein
MQILTGHSSLDGHPTKLIKLQDDFKDKYEALTKEEREELVEEFTAQRDERGKIKWPTPKARIANVANVVRNIQLLVCHFKDQQLQAITLTLISRWWVWISVLASRDFSALLETHLSITWSPTGISLLRNSSSTCKLQYARSGIPLKLALISKLLL